MDLNGSACNISMKDAELKKSQHVFRNYVKISSYEISQTLFTYCTLGDFSLHFK